MGDGLLNKKVAFIIQARMKSARLPGKILLPIPLANGKPLLSWIIDELKNSRYNHKIIIATSVNIENDVLVSFCDVNKISCFRGEEENVLSRFIEIVKQENYDCVVRLTADNPIVDITFLDDTITNHFANGNDYTSTVGMPVGMNFEVISPGTLLDMEHQNLTDPDKEHVTLFVKNNDRYKKGVFPAKVRCEFKNLRLTVDYASDYALLSTVLSLCSNDKSLSGLHLIEKTYDTYPWLFESNRTNVQKKQYNSIEEEISEAYDLLLHFDFKQAAEILTRSYKN